MSDEIEEYRAVANALASWSDGPLAGDARKAITALIGMYETQASKLDTWQKALDSMRQERYHFSTELKAAESRLDTLQKNYDLGQAALALAESEGKEVASRWATAVTLLEKAERERNEARSRLVSVEGDRDAWRDAYRKMRDRHVEIRMPGGELDEIVGSGGFHVEQMDDNYWFFELAGCAFFVDGDNVELRIRDFGSWDEAMKHYAKTTAVEGRFTCLDCDAPIPEPGYCAPCIEKMRELIDPPAVKDRGPHANTCASLMGIDCDCSLSFEQKSVVEKNGPPAECNCLPFVCMQECLPPDTACREETKRVSEVQIPR